MFKGIESILVIKQEVVVLPRAKPTIIECVLVLVKMKYNEPIFN
jgi:hypothetical protein